MVTIRPAPFALAGWNYTASKSRLSAFLNALQRPDITKSYCDFGGLALSRELAQLLVDNEHFSGISFTWTTPSWLRLPLGTGSVVLEPSCDETHWLSSCESIGATFPRMHRENMLAYMNTQPYSMWIVRPRMYHVMTMFDIGFSQSIGEPILRISSRKWQEPVAIVTLRGQVILEPRCVELQRASVIKAARYLAHMLPSMGITFGARLRCAIAPTAWYALDLRPLPLEVRKCIEAF